MRRVRPRRSCHSVPATRPRMTARAPGLDADVVFLDLEDSVPAAEKGPEAHEAVRAALAGAAWTARSRGVRVNPVGTPWCLADLRCAVACGDAVDLVVVPKVEDPGHVAFVCHALDALEMEAGRPVGALGVELQIESAAALAGVTGIAASAPARVEALVFGPGDFAASLGAPQTMVGERTTVADPADHALFLVAVAARAHGLQCVDGPYGDVGDPDGLRRSAERARALGFDGKWSVHPGQIAVLNDVFRPSAAEVERARAILAALAGGAAARMGGEMVDEATRRLAEGVLRRAG